MKILFGNQNIDILTPNSIEFQRVLFVIKEKCVGRKYNPSTKTWYIPRNLANYNFIKKFMPSDIKPQLDDEFNGAETRVDKLTFLREYQNEAIKDIIKGKKLISLPCGSGKTFCALGFIESMNVKKSLFVVPSPLKEQWKSEATGFFKNYPIILEGTPKKRKEILSTLPEKTMIIVSYETARVTPELKNIHFDYMCLDECQKIKNSKTKTYKALKSIHADQITLLTATPMVNKPTDVFHLVNFAHPGFFDYYAFHERYVIYEDVWTGRGYVRSPIAFKNLSDLHEELKPVMVFKRKEDILSELPDKILQHYWIDPSPSQKQLIKYYIAKGDETATSDSGEDYKLKLACMTMMRRVADSPELLTMSKSDLAILPKDINAPKIQVLKDDIIPQLTGKTIIFTEYADMADILFRELKSENPMLVKGGMDSNKAVEDFRESTEHDILISTDVLNYGVNLQFASNVIHYDLPWSPAKIEQREGRIHRIGQDKSTLFISLITKETIEQQVFDLLKDKKDMFSSTIAGGIPIEKELIKDIFKTHK